MKKLILILLGCLMTGMGLIVLKHSNIVTGGTAGLSLIITYMMQGNFAVVFFLINLPFYIFAVFQMGWKFTLSTIFAVSTLTFMISIDTWIPNFSLPIYIGSISGGLFIGLGLTVIFMNHASLGGANILALFLQKRFCLNPGKINFLFDLLVILLSIFTVGFIRGLFSILSIYITSKVISYFKDEIAGATKPKTSTFINRKTTAQVALTE